MSGNIPDTPSSGSVKPKAETKVEDKDEVVVDEKTGETIVIPSDIASTGLKYEDGTDVPDRIVTILLSEYGDYPDETGAGFVKDGVLRSIPNVGVDKSDVMEIQHYVRKDPDGKKILDKKGEPQTMEIRKTITKKDYPIVKKLRDMIQKEKLNKGPLIAELAAKEREKNKPSD